MLSHKDFARKTKYNIDTQNQIWMSSIADSHDSWCDCDSPFSHLLASIFPPGHADRNKTINQILYRDYKKQCLSGGAAEESIGNQEPSGEIKEEKTTEDDGLAGADEELAELLAAVEEGEPTR